MNKLYTCKSEQFSEYIKFIWLIKVGEEGVKTIIPPTQYVEVVFPLNGKGAVYNGCKYLQPFLEGVLEKSVYFELPPDMCALGFRFYSFGLYPFMHYNGSDIVNTVLELFPMQKDFEAFYEAVNDTNSEKEVFIKANHLLKALFNKERAEKITLVKDFYWYLVENNEETSVKDYCDLKRIRYITLSRYFSKYVGITPKKFSRLIKFRKALDDIMLTNSNFTNVAFDSKYFDQSHFIREFKHFMGMSPKQYVSLLKNEHAGIFNYAVDFSSL